MQNRNLIKFLNVVFIIIAIYGLITTPFELYQHLTVGMYGNVMIDVLFLGLYIIVLYVFISSYKLLIKNFFTIKRLYYKQKLSNTSKSIVSNSCKFNKHKWVDGTRKFNDGTSTDIRVCKLCKIDEEKVNGKWVRNITHEVGTYMDDLDEAL